MDEMQWLRTVADGANFFPELARECAKRLLERLAPAAPAPLASKEQTAKLARIVRLFDDAFASRPHRARFITVDEWETIKAALAPETTLARDCQQCDGNNNWTEADKPVCPACLGTGLAVKTTQNETESHK